MLSVYNLKIKSLIEKYECMFNCKLFLLTKETFFGNMAIIVESFVQDNEYS